MNINTLIIVLILFILNSTGYSSINFSKNIHNITFQGIQDETVMQAIQSTPLMTKKNVLLNPRYLQSDIESFYKTGYFSEVLAESIASANQHILVFRFTQYPTIRSIRVFSKLKSTKMLIVPSFKEFLFSSLNTQHIEKRRLDINTRLQQQGFDLFSITNIEFDKSLNQLNLYVNEGIIESLTINGLTHFDQALILREMKQKPGVMFNSNVLRRDREKLLQIGYFSTVSSPQLLPGSDPSKIKVSLKVTEKKLNRISVGIEQDQEYFFGFISHLRGNTFINTDMINLKTQLQLTDDTIALNRYSTAYTQPWLFNRFNFKGILRFYNKEVQEILNDNSTTSIRQGGTISLVFPLTNALSLSSTLKKETISEGRSADNIDDYFINSAEFMFTYDNINHPHTPSKGSKIQMDYEKGNELGIVDLGGLSFSKLNISGSKFHALTPSLVLAYRLQGGIFYPADTSIDTYENEYFELGGSTSLRGYDETRNIFSGTRELLFNLEFRHMIYPNFQFVTFSDFGNAFDDTIDFVHMGYGIGLRYLTPVGPIRIDIAKGEKHYFVHFGLGQLF